MTPLLDFMMTLWGNSGGLRPSAYYSGCHGDSGDIGDPASRYRKGVMRGPPLVCVTLRLGPQVFSMFLETLVDFITIHREDLQDWLFVLLTQLLKKMGADLLGSVQAKVQKALDITR